MRTSRLFLGFSQLYIIGLALAALLASLCASGQEAGQGRDVGLARQIDACLDTPALRAGFVGVLIRSLKDDTILYERNADKLFLPASNAKLFTSGIALETLGKDFVYRTRLFRVGNLGPDGTVRGDLVIRGAGDPLLSVEDLDGLARQAKAQGIRRVSGCLRFDDSRFDRERLGEGWAWDDEPFYYAAQVSALNLNENLISVQALPGKKAGDPVSVVIGPTRGYAKVDNQATTGAAGSVSTLKIGRLRGQNVVTVRGSLPVDVKAAANLPVDVTVEDPARFTALVLVERLLMVGITIAGGIRDGPAAPAEAAVVAEHVSLPLSGLLPKLNLPSDNLVAECLLKTVGSVSAGQGTSGKGLEVERTWLGGFGIDVGGARLVDGSGLSRLDLVSPRAVVGLLRVLRGRADFDCFYPSLPVAGVSGTLRSRMKGTAAENNCHAKTGTMAFVSSLSGYVTTKGGEMLVFSILMNHASARDCRAAQDKILVLLADYARM